MLWPGVLNITLLFRTNLVLFLRLECQMALNIRMPRTQEH